MYCQSCGMKINVTGTEEKNTDTKWVEIEAKEAHYLGSYTEIITTHKKIYCGGCY